MANGKINRKYYVLIWVALLVACFVRNAYGIYVNAVSLSPESALDVFLLILKFLFSYGVVPAAVTFICALVVWYIASSRYVRVISRNDFCYLAMIVTAAVKFVVGIIELFAVLEPKLSAVTFTVFDFTLLTGAFIAVFFTLIVKWYKLNPVEKYNAFKMWFTVYMTVAGILVLVENISVLSLTDGGAFSQSVWQILWDLGIYISPDVLAVQEGASIAVICIYFAYLIAVVALGEVLRHRSEKFRDPETRGEFYSQYDNRAYNMRRDAESVFDDMDGKPSASPKKEDDNVFDEFDL